MPTADLRDLAARLDVLKPCEVCVDDHTMDTRCPGYCDDTGHRLPTEAEVRATIFEAGFGLTIYAGPKYVTVLAMRPAQASRGATERVAAAHDGEAAPGDLALLALLRALEAARG